MNLWLMMDKSFYKAGDRLRSHFVIFDLYKLGNLSNIINLPDVTTTTNNRYIG